MLFRSHPVYSRNEEKLKTLDLIKPQDLENKLSERMERWQKILAEDKQYQAAEAERKAAEAERQKNVVTGLQVGEKPMTPQKLGKLNAAEKRKVIDPLLEESKKLGEEQRRLMLEGVYNPESTKRWDELRIRQAQINKELEKYKK